MPTPRDHFGLRRIGQIAINVHDLSAATRFYRETLGMEFLFEVPGMAFFDCGGVRLMLGVASEPQFDHRSSILYYKVPDIHAAATTLEARGVKFTSQPHLVAKLPDHELWLAFFQDPDHNVLALMSEVRS
jgi:methylmalonyl-CoA/ethylmalonyl-CoA epimerase